jgi:hypothetical protein
VSKIPAIQGTYVEGSTQRPVQAKSKILSKIQKGQGRGRGYTITEHIPRKCEALSSKKEKKEQLILNSFNNTRVLKI